MKKQTAPRLKRALNPMPATIRRELTRRGLLEAYRGRPPYQQNDYLGWIARAKLEATREKRLAQMLEELARGDVYMKMSWHPGRGPRAKAKPAADARGSSRRSGEPGATRSRRPRGSAR